ncbi:SPOR domain-containing protein [Roseovarius sp. A-2]|uniref:SPOR domain-containing protein n=1 Tax=Roseovarius sp. A-2 TaxID=1570360 RepID=UPI0020CB01C0|nr:SPOR domain-containing protein [Roseovarius sp. A-2]
MKKFSLTACACVALIVGPAPAQSLRDAPVPAEFPPSSYNARQYVDSQGCIFVRAGVAGNVTWVPRMTRSREPLCGFKPTLTAQAAPQPAAPAPTPTPRAAATAAPVAATPPAPRTTASPAPAPRQVVVRTAPPTPKPEPKATPAPAPKAAAPAQTRQARVITPPDPGRTACTGATGVSAAYMVQRNGSPVRCGPQPTSYVSYVRNSTGRSGTTTTLPPGTPIARGQAPAGTRVVPTRIYSEQQKSLVSVSVPEGMQPVWEDDRLNPRRAHQTFEGMAQMEVMWTNTVPRRLIDRQTGADAIHRYPGLQPPYTSFEQQRAAGVNVATRGRITPEPQTVRRMARAATPAQPPAATQPTATVSTRSTSDDAPQSASHRYAQAGIFADASQGKAAAQKIARAGLPARRGTLNRDGRELTLVLAGPFATQTQLERGVARLHGLGFADVRLRK